MKKTHYEKHLYPYLTEAIQAVIKEQEITMQADKSHTFQDKIYQKVEIEKYQSQFKDCFNPECRQKFIPKSKLICPTCKTNLKRSLSQALPIGNSSCEDPQLTRQEQANEGPSQATRFEFKETGAGQYFMLSHKMNTNSNNKASVSPVPFQVCSPVFVNPSSYENCKAVLRTIGKKAGIRKYGCGEREWVCVCCDGSPYVLCLRLMVSTYMCDVCKVSMDGMHDVDEHLATHNGTGTYSLEFDWVMLIPGPGHLEMNMIRSLVEFCWDIFWR